MERTRTLISNCSLKHFSCIFSLEFHQIVQNSNLSESGDLGNNIVHFGIFLELLQHSDSKFQNVKFNEINILHTSASTSEILRISMLFYRQSSRRFENYNILEWCTDNKYTLMKNVDNSWYFGRTHRRSYSWKRSSGRSREEDNSISL